MTRLPGRQWDAIKALPAVNALLFELGDLFSRQAEDLTEDVVVAFAEAVGRYRNTGRRPGGVEIHGERAVAARLEVRKRRLHQGLLLPT